MFQHFGGTRRGARNFAVHRRGHDSGQALVEYALIFALVGVAVLGVVSALGHSHSRVASATGAIVVDLSSDSNRIDSPGLSR
jgi:Flp pilus assembly pilin Flp